MLEDKPSINKEAFVNCIILCVYFQTIHLINWSQIKEKKTINHIYFVLVQKMYLPRL